MHSHVSSSSAAGSHTTDHNRVPLVTVATLIVLVIVIFVPVISVVVAQFIDYGLRHQFAQAMLSGEIIPSKLETPHVLYELLVIAVYRLLPGISIANAGLLVAITVHVFLALVIYLVFGWFLGRPTAYRTGLSYVVATLTVMLVTPITLFTARNLYFGYVGITVYHSPTFLLLKPFALLQFYFALRSFGKQPIAHQGMMSTLGIGVSLFSVLAKPSYAVVILPTVILIALYQKWKGRTVNWMLLIVGIILPSGIMLGIQSLSYNMGGLIFAPLAVIDEWARLYNPAASAGLLVKLILSLLFPITVYGLYFEDARRNMPLNFAWLGFAFGVCYTYLLAESSRVEYGNLVWSGQIALFILFVMSLAFFAGQNWQLLAADVSGKRTPRFMIGLAILALHLVSGIVWYLAHLSGMTTTDMQWYLW